MPWANPSFETVDPSNPGLAQSWVVTTIASITIAGYILTSGVERAWEQFDDGWETGFSFLLAATTTEATYSASYYVTPIAFEDFEVAWMTGFFSGALGATTVASYNTGADLFDSFETGWMTGAFTASLGTLTTALYDSGADAFDSFETSWMTLPYTTTLGSMTSAVYGQGTAYETFEPLFLPVPFTVNPSTGIFTAPAHGMANGKRVLVTSTGKLPDGLGDSDYYFVISATTNTFQLSSVSGGSAVVVTSPGSGNLTVISDGTTEWAEQLI